MPGFNDLGKGKFSVGLEKLFGIAAPGAMRSMSPELSATVPMPIGIEELQGVSGVQRWCCAFVQAGVAGQSFVAKIRNPIGSGALVILEEAAISALAAGLFTVSSGYADTADFGTVPFQEFRDGRLRPRDRGAAVVTHGTSGAQPGTGASWYGLASTPHRVPGLPYVLIPGNAVIFAYDTVNTAAALTLSWRERGATPAELAL